MFVDAKDGGHEQKRRKTPADQDDPPSGPASQWQVADRPAAESAGQAAQARTSTPQPDHDADAPPLQPEHPGDGDADQTGPRGDGRLHHNVLRRHALAIGLAVGIPLALLGYLYWDYSRHFQSTEDSFIAARQFAIQPQVSGYITAVPVTDNQHVDAGGVVARIDDRDYRIALDQANAQLAHDQGVLDQAQRNLERYQTLSKTNSIAQQQVDDQTFLVEQDRATVALDQSKVDSAHLNLSRTIVVADQPGRIVSLTAAVGQFAQSGTTLTMFVPDETWVTANFKETQLDLMRPGQAATIRIDAYPKRGIGGHVTSVQPGSGPAFSLLPPENATGNWVKIVQRVPVKIGMDDQPQDVALGPGMSVETTVRVDPHPSLVERLRNLL